MPAPVPAANIDDIDDQPIFRKKLLDKLKSPEQLDTLLTVTSPRSWLALLAFVLLLGAVLVWGFVSTIQTTVTGSGVLTTTGGAGDTLEAVLYVSLRDGQRIRVGQTLRVAPISFRPEQYGFMLGRVIQVGSAPVTQADMATALGNDALAQSLAAQGLIIEVRGEFVSAETPSGYLWTTADGPPAAIRGGTPATGQIVVNIQRPYALVFSQ